MEVGAVCGQSAFVGFHSMVDLTVEVMRWWHRCVDGEGI